MRRIFFIIFPIVFLNLNSCTTTPANREGIADGFTYLSSVDPTILQEMRYAGEHNFIGSSIRGYESAKCILTEQAAKALAQVQAELKAFSLTLKVYDCYRPQRAVDHFVAWAKDLDDNKMKGEFYPKVDKTKLFSDGYIAEKSGHSRGSTVDLTLVPLPVPSQEVYRKGQALTECYQSMLYRFKDNSLDFGTGFDCFDPLAHTENSIINDQQKRNRLLLRAIMDKHGFKNYDKEWWHFTLRNEPFPEQYFDFVVR